MIFIVIQEINVKISGKENKTLGLNGLTYMIKYNFH